MAFFPEGPHNRSNNLVTLADVFPQCTLCLTTPGCRRVIDKSRRSIPADGQRRKENQARLLLAQFDEQPDEFVNVLLVVRFEILEISKFPIPSIQKFDRMFAKGSGLSSVEMKDLSIFIQLNLLRLLRHYVERARLRKKTHKRNLPNHIPKARIHEENCRKAKF